MKPRTRQKGGIGDYELFLHFIESILKFSMYYDSKLFLKMYMRPSGVSGQTEQYEC